MIRSRRRRAPIEVVVRSPEPLWAVTARLEKKTPMTSPPASPARTWTIRIRPITRFIRGRAETRRLPPGPNARMHWAVRSWWSRSFQEEAWLRCLEAHVPKLPRARFEIVNYGIRKPDRDNLYASMKPIVDGIALTVLPQKFDKNGLPIPQDDEDHLDLQVRNVKVKTRAEEKLLVTIWSTTPLSPDGS